MYTYNRKVSKTKVSIAVLSCCLLLMVSILYTVQQSEPALPVSNETEVIRMQLPSVEVSTNEKLILPFRVDATIATHFFDSSKSSDALTNAVVQFEGVYRPSNGVDYTFNGNIFEAVAMVSGEVIDVIDDELMGRTIVVQSGDLILSYQSLSAYSVAKGDQVIQGQVIGLSGENLYNQNLQVHLHIVAEYQGRLIDPEQIIGLELAQIK